MDTAIPEEKLKEILDEIIRKVTEDSGGIQLIRGEPESELGQDVCTVQIHFRRGFHSSLSFRADTAMLTRLAQSILKKEHVTPEDLEDVAKEYFNVLCGRIASELYKTTHVSTRFSVPTFHLGSCSPENHKEQFVLHYAGDREEVAQLVHYVPASREKDSGTR